MDVVSVIIIMIMIAFAFRTGCFSQLGGGTFKVLKGTARQEYVCWWLLN